MSQEILSVAIYEPLPGKEQDSQATMQALFTALSRGGFSRDFLYHDGKSHYMLFRYWKSEDARRAAQEDPEVLRCWAKLAQEIEIVKVYEKLEVVDAVHDPGTNI
jgi:hypothetical protein